MDNNDTFISLSDRGDMALLRDVAAGREDAFIEIMNRYLPLISRTTFRILCDRNDSEAVAKQVFIYLWHNFDQYDDRFTLEEWLLRRTFYLSRLRISRRRILHFFGKRPALFAVSKPKAENTDDYITTQAWELFCRTSLKMTPVQRVVFTFVNLEQLGQERLHILQDCSGTGSVLQRKGLRKSLRKNLPDMARRMITKPMSAS